MPWCPRCRSEYRQGFKTCSDCNTDLVDQLEQITNNGDTEYDREAYLTSVPNGIEAEIIEALLNSNGIPVLKKFRKAGGYLVIYMGATNFGVDLYVPSKLLEEAKDIIASREIVEENIQPDSGEKDVSDLDEKYTKKRRIRTRIILLLFLLPGLLGIIIAVFYNLYHWIIG